MALLTTDSVTPAKNTGPRNYSIDVPVGQYAVIQDKGYNKAMHKTIIESEPTLCTVREREIVTINGVRFYVEGPADGADVQMVMLPYCLASVLINQAAMTRSADAEWASRTAKQLGGKLDDEIRG